MKYNLTPSQRSLAEFLVREVRTGRLPESFHVLQLMKPGLALPELKVEGAVQSSFPTIDATVGQLDALAEAKMLLQRVEYSSSSSGSSTTQREHSRVCTLTALIYEAVDTGFLNDEQQAIGNPGNLPRAGYVPNTAFIMMWMEKALPELDDVCNAMKDVCAEFGIKAVRADDIEHQERITDVVLQHIR